jgi:uncharacterized protein
MLLICLFLIVIEILTIVVLKESIRNRSWILFLFSLFFDIILSLWLWTLFIQINTYRGFFDNPDHVRMLMSMSGTIGAVVLPRMILIMFHYLGKLIRIRKGGYIMGLSLTGMALSLLMFLTLILSSLYGRFNFKTETIEIPVSGLNKELDGLKIVQISDLHLSSFYSHRKALQRAMDRVDSLKPDLIINTGDFVSFGWREYDSSDTILIKAKSRFGNFAILGNHDIGTYHPYFTEADRADNVLLISEKIRKSGYELLRDTNKIVRIGNAKLGLIGINTKGKFTAIEHGDLEKAMKGTDSADFKILLSHSPNHWIVDVAGKTDIDLTLSGHTHGMQMGIYTKNFRWSPASYIYPHWNGLYTQGSQMHYVNRGLGTLGMPFRIWMPPEITLLILKKV